MLSGDCSVCLTDMGQRVKGSLQYAALSGNRLYLFPNAELKEKFRSDPRKYIKADLVLGGQCAVCRVEMQQEVPGQPEIAVRHGGLTYQFASEEQRSMFLANPTKYDKLGATVGGGSHTR